MLLAIHRMHAHTVVKNEIILVLLRLAKPTPKPRFFSNIKPYQNRVAVVHPGDDKTVDYCFCCVHRQGGHTALYTAQL